MRNVVTLGLMLLVASFVAPFVAPWGTSRAVAAGAVAIGIAPGGVAGGYASGFRVDAPDVDTAAAQALATCKKPGQNVSGTPEDSGSRAAQANCKVLMTFVNKCYAQALDPKDGTPGAGWAVADTQAQAEDEAIARCRATAGASRQDYCKIFNHNCDGSAK